jgi:hypothetical protein
MKLCDRLNRPPLLDEGAVYLAAEFELIKVSRRSWREEWRVRFSDENGYIDPVLVHESTIVIWDCLSATAVSSDDGARLWGPSSHKGFFVWKNRLLSATPLAFVNPVTGEVERRLDALGPMLGSTVADDVIVRRSVTETGDPVVAFDLSEEKLLWSRDLRSELAPTLGPRPILGCMGHGLLLAFGNRLGVCSVDDPKLLWSRDVGRIDDFAVVDGKLHMLVTGREGPRFMVLRADSGEEILDVPVPIFKRWGRPLRGPLIREQLTFGTEGGVAGVLDPSTGEPLWSYHHETDSDYKTGVRPPLISGGEAFTTTENGELLVFDLSEEVTRPARRPVERDEEGRPDDPDVYLSTVVVRDADGKEEVHICLGVQDKDTLMFEGVAAFVDAASDQWDRPEFGRHIKVIILGSTPKEAKAALPELRAELSRLAAQQNLRVTVTEQDGGW